MENKRASKLRIITVTLIIVLIIALIGVSGTLARYISENKGVGSVSISKWGIELDATVYSAFENEYAGTDGKVTVSATEKIIAPGTKGDVVSVAISGKADVNAKVIYKADIDLENWLADGAEYCPLEINVNGTTYKINGTTVKTVSELELAVENAVAAYTRVYKYGTELKDKSSDEIKISWKWDYAQSAGAYQTDAKDTLLGNSATGSAVPKITISLTASVEQTTELPS